MKKRKGIFIRKIMAAMLSVALVAGIASNSVPVSVWAQESNTASGTDWELGDAGKLTISADEGMDTLAAPHIHKICADPACADGSHEDVEWKALTYTEGKMYADGEEIPKTMSGYELDGNYYLADNLTIEEEQICIQNAVVHLCLNGKTLHFGKSSVWIYGKSELTLCDCAGNGLIESEQQAAVSIADITSGKRVFIMYGGSIQGSGRDFYSRGHKEAEAKFLGGSVTNMEVKLPQDYDTGSLTTPVFIGQPVKPGTKIKIDFSWSEEYDGKLPIVPVVKAEEGYALTETDLANLDIEVIARGYTDIEFQKKIENGVIVLYRHSHVLTKQEAVPATCNKQGTGEYWKCEGTDGCGKMFSDAGGQNEITQAPVGEAALGHSFSEEWMKDKNAHYHECARCGAKKDYSSHFWNQSASDMVCNVCGYDRTPLAGGTVTMDVAPGEGAPATSISTPTETLENMLLTEEEKQKVQSGDNIRIVLEVKDAGNTVKDSDKAGIEEALNGFTVGQYLNIDLYTMTGETRREITRTEGKIRIVLNVPDSLKSADQDASGTFAVIRVHEGGTEILPDLDDDANTITIETDRFSTYAIVYKDTPDDGNGGSGDNTGNNSGSGSGDNTGNNGGSGSGDNTGNNGGSGSGDNTGNNGGSGNSGNNDGSDDAEDSDGDDSPAQNDVQKAHVKDNEPKTGGIEPLELYATLAMIAGFAYLLLYFAGHRSGMTEKTKKELVARLVGWAKQGGKARKLMGLAAVFVLLVYYHSIGKKTQVEWKAVYGE